MRLTLFTPSVAALLATGAGAETIGVSMQSFDNNFQTLLRHGIGLLRPKSGQVRVAGKDARVSTVAQLARTVGYVFQSPSHMLFAPTVRDGAIVLSTDGRRLWIRTAREPRPRLAP